MKRCLAHPIAVLAFAALLAACKDEGNVATDAGGNPPSDAAFHADHVRCEFYYRVTNESTSDTDPADLEFQEEVLEVGPDEDQSVELGDLSLSVSYSDDRFEGSSLHVRVDAGDNARLFSTLYQLRDGKLPDNQFVGDHGFTGLMHLTHPTEGGDYQLICKSAGGG